MLNAPADRLLEQFKTNGLVQINRPEPISAAQAFEERVTPAEVRGFLEQNFGAEHDKKTMVAEILAEDVEYHTIGSVTSDLKLLHSALEESARARGLDPANDRMIVQFPEYGGSSELFMTYLYSRANGLGKDRTMTFDQFRALSADNSRQLRPLIIEDAFYSGQQIQSVARNINSTRTTAASLSAFDQFALKLHETKDSLPIVPDLVSLQTDFSLNALTPDFIGADDRFLFNSLTQQSGYGGLVTLKVFPHMLSDTSPHWLSYFARRVIFRRNTAF